LPLYNFGMKNHFYNLVAFFIILIFNTFGYSQPSFTLIHTNDTHSQIEPCFSKIWTNNVGGVIRRYAAIQEIRKSEPHLLLLDAGDFLQGTPYFNYFGGEVEIHLMNMMGYDVVALGNHEFDNGSAALAKKLKKACFTVVCANYIFHNKNLSKIVKPYTTITVDGIKVGIFGLLTNLQELTSPTTFKEVTFFDPIGKAKEVVSILKNKYQCDLIICLSHLGIDATRTGVNDIQLAEQVGEIDIIIGGHTHKYLETPYVVNNVQILQAGSAGAYLGKMKISRSTNQ